MAVTYDEWMGHKFIVELLSEEGRLLDTFGESAATLPAGRYKLRIRTPEMSGDEEPPTKIEYKVAVDLNTGSDQ